VAVNWDMVANGMEVGQPESWVNQCYYLETWKKVYSYHIGPINGIDLWPKSTCPTTLTPPKHHNPIGRPKKKRQRNQVEIDDQLDKGGKVSKKWRAYSCGKCGNLGHNSRSCNGRGGEGGSGSGAAPSGQV
jgi:hypothetical protein